MADKNLNCKDCGKEFVFTEGEQTFYKEKGFENDPVRCTYSGQFFKELLSPLIRKGK